MKCKNHNFPQNIFQAYDKDELGYAFHTFDI